MFVYFFAAKLQNYSLFALHYSLFLLLLQPEYEKSAYG